MSPMMMALLGLLAYKALKGRGSQPAAPGSTGGPIPLPPGGTASSGNPGGGIGDILGGLLGGKPTSTSATNVPAGAKPGGSLSDLIPGGLGGLLGGAAAGSVLAAVLATSSRNSRRAEHGQVAQSWVGTGPNQDIAPQHLADALGGDTLDALSQHRA